jgi:hypothetical protein
MAGWVVDQTGARVEVVADSVGGQPEATDYLALFDLIARKVSDAAGAAAR